MTATAETTDLIYTPFASELSDIIEAHECKPSATFVWFELDEGDEAPNECSLTFYVKDDGMSRLVISGDDKAVTVEHVVLYNEVTPQINRLGGNLKVLLNSLAEKHNVKITYGDFAA